MLFRLGFHLEARWGAFSVLLDPVDECEGLLGREGARKEEGNAQKSRNHCLRHPIGRRVAQK